MKTNTLNDLFLTELADMYDAERRIVRALPKLARAAAGDALKRALLAHARETEGHVKKIEQVFDSLAAKARGRTCEATVGLLAEAAELAVEFKGSPAIDAALIAATQKVEHYEMASYGCLHEWAGLLGYKKAAGLLLDILEEERAANDALTGLARAGCNSDAVAPAPIPPAKGGGGIGSVGVRRPATVRRAVRPLGLARRRSGSRLR